MSPEQQLFALQQLQQYSGVTTPDQQKLASQWGKYGLMPAGVGWWDQPLTHFDFPAGDERAIARGRRRGMRAARVRVRDYNDLWEQGTPGVKDLLNQLFPPPTGIPDWVMEGWRDNPSWTREDMLGFLSNPPESLFGMPYVPGEGR